MYHFRTGDFKKAVENFIRSKNETPSAEAFLYTAYAYFKQGLLEKALNELETGLKQFPADKALEDLNRQLKQQEKNHEKDTDSVNRQR